MGIESPGSKEKGCFVGREEWREDIQESQRGGFGSLSEWIMGTPNLH